MMDSPDYWRFVAALVFVLGLILAVAWVVRRAGLRGYRALPSASLFGLWQARWD